MNTSTLTNSMFLGEFIEDITSIKAGGCDYKCYSTKISPKGKSPYTRVFCSKLDKKCKPYLEEMPAQQEAEYRGELRDKMGTMGINKIKLWTRSGEKRVYITPTPDSMDSGKFATEKEKTCNEKLFPTVAPQSVLYITGNKYEKPGTYKYLGDRCGGSNRYPVSAYMKPSLFSREKIEKALGFKLDSDTMMKLKELV